MLFKAVCNTEMLSATAFLLKAVGDVLTINLELKNIYLSMLRKKMSSN